ncbi:MAG: alpha-glucan family phosphorylase [Leptospiraceae bacterium]|nr:alpha-glucan family phosphorylase [Leptospiraceae bacterium]MDW8307280.1 alpha-glucan family phosphorylase [Leptospiraceae bacterium]
MALRSTKTFQITPYIPEKLKPLAEIARNYWWCWNYEAIELFQSIDIDRWHRFNHNPIKLLAELEPERLEELAHDDNFLIKMQTVYIDLQDYLSAKTYYKKITGGKDQNLIAYFSAEFGIHESLPNYSGGLGVLAGDHLKSASDLGLPLVGVGLLYHRGYFSQYLNEDGWQQEDYPILDFFELPVELVKDEKQDPLIVDVDFPGRKVYCQIWQVRVGRIKLYLLDTNIELNSHEDRHITDILYGGDTEHRIQQELVLGIGGIRALKKMGLHPTTVHLNEGHSAFCVLERIRAFVQEDGLSFEEALNLVRASTVFTTHTPVPAGNEVFPDSLISKYLEPYLNVFQIPLDQFLDLGRIHQHQRSEYFGMTVFSLRVSAFANGVSRLHGRVAREMWHEIWENLKPQEVPIYYITNGIHIPSWISDEMDRLYRRYLGPEWLKRADKQEIFNRVQQIPNNELWRAKLRLKDRLVSYVRETVRQQLEKKRASQVEIEDAMNLLDTEALTIGFSRRFATYKRATLLLKDRERLIKLLCDPNRPVQFIFAGKAHPRDMEGKKLIKEIVHFSREAGAKNKIVFLENYDIRMARYLVQGVDVWLNNPRRPLEASGTSGMKVLANGGINLSILDGWWAEAYKPEMGWAIGAGEEYQDYEYQDYVESRALYDILEKEVIPRFYDRGPDNIPRRWLELMKGSIMYGSPQYHTDRMVKEYTRRFYLPSSQNYLELVQGGFRELKKYTKWLEEIRQKWPEVRVGQFYHKPDKKINLAREKLEFYAHIHTAGIPAQDLEVCLVYHREGDVNEYEPDPCISMYYLKEEEGQAIFHCEFTPARSGGYSYSVRITPRHEKMLRKLEPGLIKWA